MDGETHIAHAIATFSELGIAAGALWLSDIAKLRSDLDAQLVVATESLRVTTENYHAKASEIGGFIDTAIRKGMAARKLIYSFCIKLLLGFLHWSPPMCIGLGVLALVGISFYPTVPDFMPSFFSYSRESGSLIFFIMSLMSFTATFVPTVVRMTERAINRYALKDIKIA